MSTPTDGTNIDRYDFGRIQKKWIPRWQEQNLYATGTDPDKPKFYCLDFFPYPSGSGLSVGHLRNYVPTDVVSRYRRMRGDNVLHPMGWDAFGLPAENYALEMGVHPRDTTAQNVANYKRQLALAEISFDWDHEINSTDPGYYRWTQWFFLLLHERGLAYQDEGMQWWCPECQTILANEQVENGRCWRHDETEVTRKKLRQWYFKITEYAQRLIDDLESVDWPGHIKKMQVNWIGRSEGTEARFTGITPGGERIDLPIFTTRIDTVFGVTYMVIAPEHPLLPRLTHPDHQAEVDAYVHEAMARTDMDRMAADREKTGVFTGCHAENPFTGETVPIWVADYVLAHYGTGIIMAVPSGDSRDHAFATRYGLPIIPVIEPPDGTGVSEGECYTGYGIMVNSREFNGLHSEEAIPKLNAWLEERGLGRARVSYKFRDWLISRQRYWGCPIPIVHCDACGAVPVPRDDLPVLLPDVDDFRPSGTGRSPLERVEAFVKTTCPSCGREGRRETDTMDGFACSSWYFLRFPEARLDSAPFTKEQAAYWLPVDLYVGGAEHAVMHLLYARFWTKVMYDAGLVPFHEPFACLRNQGMVLGPDGQKMSKSKGNVVTPDDVVAQYGTDTLRAFLLFLGSFEQEVAWSDEAINGIHRFHQRVWDLVTGRRDALHSAGDGKASLAELRRKRHATIKKLTQDIDSMAFNTGVAALMEYVNAMVAVYDSPGGTEDPEWDRAVETLLLLMAPISPFLAEELWEVTGRARSRGSVHTQAWPAWDEAELVAEEVTYPVQINGKIRDRVTVPAGVPEDQIRETVLAREKVRKYVEGKDIAKFIVVHKRLVSIAVR